MNDDDEFRLLIEQSSLGTSGAKSLRARIAPERADAVRRLIDLEASAKRSPTAAILTELSTVYAELHRPEEADGRRCF